MILQRGMVVNVNLDFVTGSETGKIRPCIIVTNDIYNERVPVIQVVPLTSWNEKKALIKTNIVIEPTEQNGLSKLSVADCLQTRPIDRRYRLERVIGRIAKKEMQQIDQALRIVFELE